MKKPVGIKWLLSQMLPMPFIARYSVPVLSYHACFKDLPPNIAAVDNVTPGCLYDHLAALKKYYRFVCIDELCTSKSRRGVAAVTFDDGYRSVIESALPVCASLDIPLTLFVSTLGLEGKTFWRHKVVAIEQNGLVAQCERSLVQTRKLSGVSWHHYSKHPSNNSKVVEREVDAFLERESVQLKKSDYLLNSLTQFVDHPLLWYGNHSHHHYVLSSLSRAEQYEEISTTQRILASLRIPRISNVFSIPFGQPHHFDHEGLAVLRELGFKAALLNRGRVNCISPFSCDGIEIIDRFTPETTTVQWPLRREFLRTQLHRSRQVS